MTETTVVKLKPGRARIIERPRLTRLLDESGARIILLIAPAGYGKTTLARQWLSQGGRKVAWYQGTPASADVAALAIGVAAATSGIVPGAGQRMKERLKASAAETETLADLFCTDLADWPSDAWLAVDDYHVVLGSPSDDFVSELVARSPIRLLVTSRQRPEWATARHSIYGDFFEVEREQLALNAHEAAAILAHGPKDVTELLERAQGWPAVIGLAAKLNTFRLPSDALASLHRFFAEELYEALDTEVRRDLCCLSFAPRITKKLADDLLGRARARKALGQGVRVGFFAPPQEGRLSLHPLLRDFLTEKSLEGATAEAEIVARLIRRLLAEGSFDDSFFVIERAGSVNLLEEHVVQALEPTLRAGRLATVVRWIEMAASHGLRSPVFDLARAELAFRRGELEKAELLAVTAARRLRKGQSLTSNALFLAGQSAHLNNRPEDALRHHTNALGAARTRAERAQAQWGRFLTSIELENDAALEALTELEAASDGSPDQIVRIVTGRLVLAQRITGLNAPSVGGLEGVLESCDLGLQLSHDVSDPVIRTSFLHTCAHAMYSLGDFSRGLGISEDAIEDAESMRLDFTLPYAHLVRTSALIGLRRFRAAAHSLTLVHRFTRASSDPFLTQNAQALRATLLLSQGRVGEALVITEAGESRFVGRGLRGQMLSLRGLAYASLGRGRKALRLVDRATSLTGECEVSTNAALVRAISHLDSPRQRAELDKAFGWVRKSGYISSLVLACRAFPGLLEGLSADPAKRSYLAAVLANSRDQAIARRAGLPFAKGGHEESHLLSAREREVCSLLADGLSNRDIARALFISEATAKVHVRHIFEKLGVRSRTEAAVLFSSSSREMTLSERATVDPRDAKNSPPGR
jgi:DNA-binding CsgD family transcriptional regulator